MLQSSSGLNQSLTVACLSACHIFGSLIIGPQSSTLPTDTHTHRHTSSSLFFIFPVFLLSLFLTRRFILLQSVIPDCSLLSRFPLSLSSASFCSVCRGGEERRGGTSCLYMPHWSVTPSVLLLIHIFVFMCPHNCLLCVQIFHVRYFISPPLLFMYTKLRLCTSVYFSFEAIYFFWALFQMAVHFSHFAGQLGKVFTCFSLAITPALSESHKEIIFPQCSGKNKSFGYRALPLTSLNIFWMNCSISCRSYQFHCLTFFCSCG